MTGKRHRKISGESGENRHREEGGISRLWKEKVFGKWLAVFVPVFLEWMTGQGFRPGSVRLQDLFFLVVLCRAAVTDARTGLIPDQYVRAIFVLAGIGFLCRWLSGIFSGADCFTAGSGGLVFDHLAGLVCLSLPFLLLAVFSPGSIGGGDIKLLAAGGFYMGAGRILPAFFLAMILAGTAGAVLILTGRRRFGDTIPLGPFLCAGMTLLTFFGD